MRAPERLIRWWRSHRKAHKSFPFEVSYHPRSDEHSKILCQYVLEDLIEICASLAEQARRGEICYDLNHEVYRLDGTKKVLDLVIGQPQAPLVGEGVRKGTVVTPGIRVALEAKACMTSHTASKPRLRDELTGSMRSAVEASPHAVVCGIAVVNAAASFVSPLDQPDPIPVTSPELRRKKHKQPKAAAGVVEMLERLPLRQDPPETGFDSLGIIVVSHDNELPVPSVELITSLPCPQTASPRSYQSFLIDICNKYRRRFG